MSTCADSSSFPQCSFPSNDQVQLSELAQHRNRSRRRYPGNGLDFVAVRLRPSDRPNNAQTVVLTTAAAPTQASNGYNALDQLTSGTGLSGIVYNSDGEQETITGPSP